MNCEVKDRQEARGSIEVAVRVKREVKRKSEHRREHQESER